MKILGFETASGRCSVALSEDANIMATELIFENSMQAENLTNMVEKVLQKRDLDISDLDYIATTNGPGSFTGIRIGLSAILGLSVSASVKPVILSNFDIINHRIREQYRDFDKAYAIIDAYRDECYITSYDRAGKKLGDPAIMAISEILRLLEAESSKIAVAGSGAKYFASLASADKIILPRFPHPDARSICKLAHSHIRKDRISSEIQPLYIRAPDAKLPNMSLRAQAKQSTK